MPSFFSALKASIEARDLKKLQKKLQALDTQIEDALCVAVREGLAEAIPLLWGRLTPSGKQKFLDAKNSGDNDYLPPLHEAVKHGHLDVVTMLLGAPFEFNINQKDRHGRTPLFYATNNLEITRFLLENGADADQRDRHGYTPIYSVISIINSRGGYPLSAAIHDNNADVARLLLQYGADANQQGGRDSDGFGIVFEAIKNCKIDVACVLLEYGADPNVNRKRGDDDGFRCTDLAIWHGDTKTLSMLLQRDAFVGGIETEGDTTLRMLLVDDYKSRETKVAIVQMLAHAKKDHATLLYLQASLEFCIECALETTIVGWYDEYLCSIRMILEVGVIPTSEAFYIAIRKENVTLCQLLVRHGGNPFLPVLDDDARVQPSPFIIAACEENISIFAYFLDLWYNEFFAASQGKDANGDDPLHVICRDMDVSLQAIMHVAARHVDAVTTLSGREGLFPFQIAAVANADLNIIFYLLNHCPDALRQFRLHTVTDPVSTGNTSSGPDKKKNDNLQGHDGVAIVSLEDFNALRDENEYIRTEKDAAVKSLEAEIEKLQQGLGQRQRQPCWLMKMLLLMKRGRRDKNITQGKNDMAIASHDTTR